MTADDICFGMQLRSIRLNRSATTNELHSLESALHLTLHPFFLSLLSKFNGFVSYEYDQKSQLCIWGTNELISHSDMMTEVNGNKRFLIGDVLIYSDFLTCSLENDSTPGLLLYEGRPMASSINEFFERLIKGAFDFI
jgi:hypothetical protein